MRVCALSAAARRGVPRGDAAFKNTLLFCGGRTPERCCCHRPGPLGPLPLRVGRFAKWQRAPAPRAGAAGRRRGPSPRAVCVTRRSWWWLHITRSSAQRAARQSADQPGRNVSLQPEFPSSRQRDLKRERGGGRICSPPRQCSSPKTPRSPPPAGFNGRGGNPKLLSPCVAARVGEHERNSEKRAGREAWGAARRRRQGAPAGGLLAESCHGLLAVAVMTVTGRARSVTAFGITFGSSKHREKRRCSRLAGCCKN